jgi:hypothetical protein
MTRINIPTNNPITCEKPNTANGWCFLLMRPAKKSADPHNALERSANKDAMGKSYRPASHENLLAIFILRTWMRMGLSD